MDLGHDGGQNHVRQRDEGRDDEDVGADPDLPRNPPLQKRYEQARSHEHEEGRQPHRDAVRHRVGDGQRRAEPQHLHQHRVLAPDAAAQILGRGGLPRHQPPSS